MAFTSPSGRTQSSLSEINVTPLVDVMLVLLIIFMVTTPIIQTGIEVNLPRTRHVRDAAPRQQYVVSIDRGDQLFFMTRPIRVTELGSALLRETGNDTSQPVYLQADGDVRFAVVVKVMDVLRESGFVNLQVVTRPVLGREGP